MSLLLAGRRSVCQSAALSGLVDVCTRGCLSCSLTCLVVSEAGADRCSQVTLFLVSCCLTLPTVGECDERGVRIVDANSA